MKMTNNELLRVLEVSLVGQTRVADIYTGCSMSLAPLRSDLCIGRPSHCKSSGKVMKMTNNELLRVLEVSLEGQPRVAEIYTSCSMSLAPLRSVLGSRRSSH